MDFTQRCNLGKAAPNVNAGEMLVFGDGAYFTCDDLQKLQKAYSLNSESMHLSTDEDSYSDAKGSRLVVLDLGGKANRGIANMMKDGDNACEKILGAGSEDKCNELISAYESKADPNKGALYWAKMTGYGLLGLAALWGSGYVTGHGFTSAGHDAISLKDVVKSAARKIRDRFKGNGKDGGDGPSGGSPIIRPTAEDVKRFGRSYASSWETARSRYYAIHPEQDPFHVETWQLVACGGFALLPVAAAALGGSAVLATPALAF